MVVVAGAWSLTVPVQFEYRLISKWRPAHMPVPEASKYSQELAKTAWLAAIAFLAFIHTGALAKAGW